MQNFDYQFDVNGNFTAAMDGMVESTGRFNAAVKTSAVTLGKLGQTLAVWDLASNYVSKFNDTLGGLSAPGISLNRQMHDLSAVAGVTGDSLKQIEGYARSSAKAFGIDASKAVDVYSFQMFIFAVLKTPNGIISAPVDLLCIAFKCLSLQY